MSLPTGQWMLCFSWVATCTLHIWWVYSHKRNSHTLSASSGDRGIKWGKLCGKSSKKKIMQDLYVGFADDWLGFKTCIHQLMGRGHSGTTPTDSQTLCLGSHFLSTLEFKCQVWLYSPKHGWMFLPLVSRCDSRIKTNSASFSRISFFT